MAILIREAQLSDYKGIHELFLDGIKASNTATVAASYKDSYIVERLKESLEQILMNSKKCMFVAEYDKAITGIILVSIHQEEQQFIPPIRARRYASVEFVEVRKKFQKQGLGIKLMRRAESWAKNMDIRILDLEVFEHNTKVLPFYEKLGYKTARRILSKTVVGS